MKTPEKITESLYHKSLYFLERPIRALMLGGILAGLFVGIAAITTITATCDMKDYFGLGFTRIVSGIVFSFGLITIVLSGSELFTGSNLYVVALYKDRRYVGRLLRNWVILYGANFIGSLLLVFIIWGTGIYEQEVIRNALIETAKVKLGLTWMQAFIRGILCNFLVCLAIRVGEAAEQVSGKILGYIFVVGAFVMNSFEHSVANMFFIPTGIFLGKSLGIYLSWQSFILNNLIPVTLGNILGGSLFIGIAYHWLHKKRHPNGIKVQKVGA